MKAVLRRKVIALSVFIKKLKRFYTSNIIAHMKALEQKEETHPRGVDRRK